MESLTGFGFVALTELTPVEVMGAAEKLNRVPLIFRVDLFKMMTLDENGRTKVELGDGIGTAVVEEDVPTVAAMVAAAWRAAR